MPAGKRDPSAGTAGRPWRAWLLAGPLAVAVLAVPHLTAVSAAVPGAVASPTASVSPSGAVSTPANPPPPAPSGLTATTLNSSAVTLTWLPPGGIGPPVIGYDVYQAASPGGEGTAPVNSALVTGTSDTITGLVSGTTYYFDVAAVSADCPLCQQTVSPPSGEASATTAPGPVPASSPLISPRSQPSSTPSASLTPGKIPATRSPLSSPAGPAPATPWRLLAFLLAGLLAIALAVALFHRYRRRASPRPVIQAEPQPGPAVRVSVTAVGTKPSRVVRIERHREPPRVTLKESQR